MRRKKQIIEIQYILIIHLVIKGKKKGKVKKMDLVEVFIVDPFWASLCETSCHQKLQRRETHLLKEGPSLAGGGTLLGR